jgi:hypothetical protein
MKPLHAWLSLAAVPLIALAPVRAELPPWVYAEEQRSAPLVADLQVISVAADASFVVVKARVLRLERQPAAIELRPGDSLEVRYPLPPKRAEGWVGPAPLPLLRSGERVTAWLVADPELPRVWAPAAGGRSFGPSLEDLPSR